jgi:RimJ/RimL family protein N-acetyltransferase
MSRHPKPRTLETERFILRPISPFAFSRQTFHWTADTEAMGDLFQRSKNWTRLRWWRYLRRFSRGNRHTHGIWPKGSDRPIGMHGIVVDGSRTASLNVLIGEQDWWGKSVVEEVRSAVLDDAFDHMRVERAVGLVRARNFPSVFNYRKLGFKHEGTMRQHFIHVDGKRADSLIFGLLKNEWLTRRAARAERKDEPS